MAGKTRLGLGGFSRSPYGSFAGRTEEVIVTVRDTVTRLGLYACTRGLYGSFAGRVEEEIDDTPSRAGRMLAKKHMRRRMRRGGA